MIRAARTDPDFVRDQVVRRYREPVCRLLARKGLSQEDAEDLAQEILLRVCRDDFLERADRAKGRFRSLLLAVSQHVVDSWYRQRYAQKRTGGRVSLDALEDPGRLAELADRAAPLPDEAFDREWAKNVLAWSRARLEEESSRLGAPYAVAVEEHYYRGKPLAEIARGLGRSEQDVKNFLHRGRARLRDFILEFVRGYCVSEEESAAELAELGRHLEP